MDREAEISRKTKETDIRLKLRLDGTGLYQVETGIPFMDHMLGHFAVHAFMDMEVTAKGDTQIDDHHTVEDLGICLGMALKDSLGEKKGIRRFGYAFVPLDESLVRVVIDVSGRPFLSYQVPLKETRTGTFDVSLIRDFFRGITNNAGICAYVDLISGEEPHHISEAVFKAFGRALDQAVTFDDRLGGEVPSTKGTL